MSSYRIGEYAQQTHQAVTISQRFQSGFRLLSGKALRLTVVIRSKDFKKSTCLSVCAFKRSPALPAYFTIFYCLSRSFQFGTSRKLPSWENQRARWRS